MMTLAVSVRAYAVLALARPFHTSRGTRVRKIFFGVGLPFRVLKPRGPLCFGPLVDGGGDHVLWGGGSGFVSVIGVHVIDLSCGIYISAGALSDSD